MLVTDDTDPVPGPSSSSLHGSQTPTLGPTSGHPFPSPYCPIRPLDRLSIPRSSRETSGHQGPDLLSVQTPHSPPGRPTFQWVPLTTCTTTPLDSGPRPDTTPPLPLRLSSPPHHPSPPRIVGGDVPRRPRRLQGPTWGTVHPLRSSPLDPGMVVVSDRRFRRRSVGNPGPPVTHRCFRKTRPSPGRTTG